MSFLRVFVPSILVLLGGAGRPALAEPAPGRVIAWGGTAGPPPASVNGTDGTATAIAAGQAHACAIEAGTGAVVCWGNDDYGQTTPPPSVDGTDGSASAIAARDFTSCAIQAGTGAVVCWGNDYAGQAMPPAAVDGSAGTATAVAVGGWHTCAIQAGSGAVVCWGGGEGPNDYGQAQPPPSVNGAAGSATAIAAGWAHSCAIQAGTHVVVCWGRNDSGQAAPPPSVNGIFGTASAIAVGQEHSCAIRRGSRAVVCWGSNPGRATPPQSGAMAIAASYFSSCALRAGAGAVVCWGFDFAGPLPASVDGSAGAATAIAIANAHGLAIQAAECADGLDADGDGLIDHPADPGCESPSDLIEKRAGVICDDGLDNDADREVDFPADPGCASATDANERGAAFACDDADDDDGDGLADVPDDPGCDAASDDSENSPLLVCDDGVDNDGDGGADHPGDVHCVSGVDPEESPDACDDGIDNEGDGFTDHPADPDCTGINDDSEATTPVFELVSRLDSEGATLTVGSDGNVYGTSSSRHTPSGSSAGTVFRIDAAGTFATLHSFSEGESAGRLAVGQDGALYGVTGGGTFFRIDSEGTYAPLLSLPVPVASDLVVGSDGAFYAATATVCPGMSCHNDGIVKITSAGTHALLGGALGAGSPPVPVTVGSDGAVYGSRFEAIDTIGLGSLFRLDPVGSFTILHRFSPEEGFPSRFVSGSDGLFYAVVPHAGSHGTVLRFGISGEVTRLHGFSGLDGAYPAAPLAAGSDGAMYGVTEWGGAAGGGTLFRIDRAGAFASLHSFRFTDGGSPAHSLLRANDADLYGVAQFGALFSVDDATGTVTTFPVIPIEASPSSALVQGNDCALYGVATLWDTALGQSDTTVYRVYTPGEVCQSIRFDPLPDRNTGDPPFTIGPTASSGLPVSARASGSCTLSGSQVTLTGAGICRLTASQAGNAEFEPASEVTRGFQVRLPSCADGLDDDADGDVDHPADPGCDSPGDRSERGGTRVCDDGLDNDADGLADVPDDPGCDTSSDDSETGPLLVCDDGVDNDGDGSADYPDDPHCVSSIDPAEAPDACGDGIDNDGDGRVDAGSDPDCASVTDTNENAAPVAICQDVTVPTRSDSCGPFPAAVDGGSSDADGHALDFEQSPAGPYALGTTPVTLQVTDPLGEEHSCQALVTVADDTPPVVDCGPALVPRKKGAASLAWSATDGCGPTVARTTRTACFVVKKNGRRVERRCDLLVPADLSFRKLPKPKTHVAWTVIATDAAGNQTTRTCETIIGTRQP